MWTLDDVDRIVAELNALIELLDRPPKPSRASRARLFAGLGYRLRRRAGVTRRRRG